MFFTPDGELLDFSSDDDDGHNVTFSSTSAVEGRTHPPFAQYAVLGDNPDATGGGDDSGHAEGVFMSPSRVKRRKIPKIQHGGESGSTGESANPGLFEAPGGIGVGGALGGGVEIEMGATRAAEGTAGVLTVQPKPEYPPEGRCSAAEATGGTAGAATEAATAAAAAAGKARAAQDAAVSRAAAKAAEAAEAHAQVGKSSAHSTQPVSLSALGRKPYSDLKLFPGPSVLVLSRRSVPRLVASHRITSRQNGNTIRLTVLGRPSCTLGHQLHLLHFAPKKGTKS